MNEDLWRGAAAGEQRLPRFLGPLIVLLMVVVLGSPILLIATCGSYRVPNDAMAPTLQQHDVVVVSRVAYIVSAPDDGDVIAFDAPFLSPNRFIKRVVAKSGDTLRVSGGRLYRNGRILREPAGFGVPAYDLQIRNYGIYVDGQRLDPNTANVPPPAKWTSADTVPPDCYIVLGDNRNGSLDSHVFGFVQPDGSFFTGPRIGERVDRFEKAIAVIDPRDRLRPVK